MINAVGQLVIELKCDIFGIIDVPVDEDLLKKVPSLENICKNVLQKSPFRKPFFVNCLATLQYPERINQWRDDNTVNTNLPIVGLNETITPTYMPEFCVERKGLEVCVLDGTHLRTNIRATVCRDAIHGIRKNAWQYVARKGNTPLKAIMIELQSDGKVLDQQNDKYQRTMFCLSVDIWAGARAL